jgi:hypothetical protein
MNEREEEVMARDPLNFEYRWKIMPQKMGQPRGVSSQLLAHGCRCDTGCILGRIIDLRIQVRGFCLTWTGSLPVTVLGVEKFSFAITGRVLCMPINVLDIRGIFHILVELLIKLLVIIGLLVTC